MQISKKKPLRAFEVTIIKKPQSGFTNNSQAPPRPSATPPKGGENLLLPEFFLTLWGRWRIAPEGALLYLKNL